MVIFFCLVLYIVIGFILTQRLFPPKPNQAVFFNSQQVVCGKKIILHGNAKSHSPWLQTESAPM